MRAPFVAVLAVLLLPWGGAALGGPEPAAGAGAPAPRERDEAINAGVRYLEKTVFALPDAAGTPRKPFTVAVTGLVHLLARDGRGIRTDGKRTLGRARACLAKYVSEVVRRSPDPAQWPARAGQFSSDRLIQYTWPLAMAALFHGESRLRGIATGASRRELRRIVPLLVECQAPNGGWGHGKVRDSGPARGASPMDGLGRYPDTLVASSSLVATSLGLVEGIAAPKPKDTLERARGYFRYAELANGNFPYDPSQRSAHKSLTGVSRAAGAVLAMRALGIDWRDVGVVRALAFVDDNFAYLSEGHGSSTHNLMLAALLQRMRGDEPWKRFKTVYFRRLLAGQQPDGAFACICEGKAFGSTNDSRPFGGKAGMPETFTDGTAAYVTAIHTLILLLDRDPPRLLAGKPPAPAAPVTTGGSGR